MFFWSVYNKEGKGKCDKKGRDNICGVMFKSMFF